jgi:hypothetical protein
MGRATANQEICVPVLVMARFAAGSLNPGHWVGVIEAERL